MRVLNKIWAGNEKQEGKWSSKRAKDFRSRELLGKVGNDKQSSLSGAGA